jgi:predicted nucleic acid-binding protein
MTEAPVSPVAYLDANVFIDFVEGTPELAEAARDLFLALEGQIGVFATSELTLAEVLAPPKSGAAAPDLKRLYMSLLVWNPAIKLIPVSRAVLYETADLRKYTRHKLPDAIHVVTAIQAGCRFLISRDSDMSKLPIGGLKRVEANSATAATLLEAFRER